MTNPIRFFGPGLIVDPHGQAIAMRARKQLALLAYLATEHQIIHSRDMVMALFWPEETPSSAQNNLRVTLSRLRALAAKLTTAEASRADLLVTDRQTVQLHPAWVASIDVNCFNALLERTRQHAHSSRSQCEACQVPLVKAVQLYQSDFLAGFALDGCPGFEEWVFMQRERLRLLVLEAYSDLAGYAEARGDWRVAGDFAQCQIDLDPLREPAYRQQMRTLAQQGERSLALASFERCRTILREELGIDPEPETLSLHTQILNSEVLSNATESNIIESHAPTMPVTSGADATTATAPPRHNLPQQLTPFFGREEELAQLHLRLANPTYRLLTIVGPGGVGKSRLAQQVAAAQLNHFRDGVYFVALAQVPTVAAIPLVIVETLHLAFSATEKSPAEQLFEMISSKELLLVLDNFEHLIEGVDLLVALLQKAPGVMLLITSRERLNLQAEDLFELQGLAVPASSADAAAAHFDAVRLFVDRAQRLDKGFNLTAAELPHVVRICQLVEGFPLAIELAATWIRELTCAEIVAELVEGLDRLETTARDVEPQHRSLRTVFNTSWRLLSPLERRTLAKLAVFSGGFTLDAARAIAGATPALLSALRNKSLLRRVGNGAGSRRYDMHALVHQFAAEALESDATTAAQARRAHSQYFLTLLADQAVALDTRASGVAGALIQPEWENVTIAWQHATAQMDAPLLQNAMDGLHRFCNLHGLYAEVETLFEDTVARLAARCTASTEMGAEAEAEAAEKEDDVQRLKLHCRLLTGLIYVAECRGQFGRTEGLAKRALAIATRLESKVEFIYIQIAQAQAFEAAADYAQGIALAEKMLGMAQAEGLEIQAGICMELIGYNAYRLGDYAHANEIYQHLLTFHEQTGRLAFRSRLAMSILGSMAIDQGQYELGLTYFQRFLASSQAADDRVNSAHAYDYLARAWNHLGDYVQAIAMAKQSMIQSDLLGDIRIKRLALLSKSYAQRQRGELTEALCGTLDAVALARICNSPTLLAQSLAQLAEAQLALAASPEAWAEAAANFHAAASDLRASGELIRAYEAEIGLADLAYRRGDMDAAQTLITPILPHLPTETAGGWDEPIHAYVVCIRILQVVADPINAQIREQGIQLLARLADMIVEQSQRHKFLNAIPAHRQLRMLRQGLAAPTLPLPLPIAGSR